MSPELLTKIGEFELKEKLGQGGYGAVYKARDSLSRDVAIKILTGFGDDITTINVFKKEAATLAKLQHPNIVTVYQFGVDNMRPYLAMEYLQGQPLSAIIKTRRELHLVEKLDIIIQATEGLKHAHENNVIHRDIKPHNLMVVESAEKSLVVKLIDFGIAQGEASKSQSQSIAGSLPYMSPEHFVQRRTPWCDVFSMGVVLYELLTGGIVPYASDRDELPVAYGKLMSQDPALPLSHHVANLPSGLEEVVAKAICKQKLKAYETAEEFLFELSRIHDVVKSQYVTERLAEVDAAIKRQDATGAYELVNGILRVDPKNTPANRKKFELKKLLEESKRNQKLRDMCVRAEGAIHEKRFDEAQRQLQEALQIDPGSPTVAQLQQKLADIRRVQARIDELVRQAQQAQISGNLDQASTAIREAASLDRSNTEVLRFQAEIDRRCAQEHNLVEQARALVHEQRFREASTVIRELESMAPRSERVLALKELATREYREYVRRAEIAAYLNEAQQLAVPGTLQQARSKLDEAIAKYPDERSLLELRATVEKQQEEFARRQFLEEKVRAGEQAIQSKNYVDAIAILEQARLRVPDSRLESLLGTAKKKAQEQAGEKRREQYIKSARTSLARGDAASAVVTLEMAQSEFGANDQQILSLLNEARSTAERQAREAAQHEEERKAAEREALRLAAEREEINAAIADAAAAAQHGNYDFGVRLIEESASKFGMRSELAQAANQIKSARTADVTAHIETLIAEADREADTNSFQAALNAIERAKTFIEFAAPPAVAKLKAAEQQIRRAQQEQETSATRIIQGSAVAPPPPASSEFDADAMTIRTSPSGSAAAPARAPIREPEQETRRLDAPPRTGTAPRPVPIEPVAPLPVPKKTPWLIPAVGSAIVVVAALIIYVVIHGSSTIQVRFEANPAGTDIFVNGEHCSAPCAAKLKPGKYAVEATHDQYTTVRKEIDVTKPYTESLTLTAISAGPARPAPVGILALAINVDSADIFVDGQLKDRAHGKNARITVAAGSHQIRLEKSGYQPTTLPVEITEGSESALAFSLEKGSGAITETTYLIVSSVPNASLVVDGKSAGNVQADGRASLTVQPGKHQVQVSLDGYENASKNVVARAGDRVNVALNLRAIPKPVPAIASFAADSLNLQAGQSTTLKWEAQNAIEISLDGETISGARGSKSVSPGATTKYMLIAKGPGGQSQPKTLTVNVAAAAAPAVTAKMPSIGTFDGPDKITPGQKAKLVWQTDNADSVTIDPELGTVKPSGSGYVNPTKDTKYTLIAKSAAGTKTQEVTVLVEAPKAAEAKPAAPAPSTAGGSEDVVLIKDLLEHRWKSAYESSNVAAARAIWPTMSKDLQNAIKNAHGIRLELICNPSVSGDMAVAPCSQTAFVSGKPNPGSVTFTLSKSSGTWLIQNSK